jgi:hypothetical protein
VALAPAIEDPSSVTRRILAVLLIVGVASACSSVTPSLSSLPSSNPSSSPAHAPTATVKATGTPQPTPTPRAGPGLIELPAGLARSVLLNEEIVPQGISSFGPVVVFADGERKLFVADLEAGSVEELATAPRGWWIERPQLGQGRVIWLEVRSERYEPDMVPCAWQGALQWRLMEHVFATGARTEVMSGIQTRIRFCYADPPFIALDEESLAVAVQHEVDGFPNAWQIGRFSMADGTLQSELISPLDVIDLAVSGTTIAYSQGRETDDPHFLKNTTLHLWDADDPEPVEVALDAYDVWLTANDVVWLSDPETSRNLDLPTAMSEELIYASLPELTPTVIATVGTHADPSVAGNLVTWLETDMLANSRLMLHDLRFGSTWVVEALDDADHPSVTGGWLTWWTSSDITGQESPFGIPLTEVAFD